MMLVMASLHEQCVDYAKTVLDAAVGGALGDVVAVHKRELPATASLKYPCLFVALSTDGQTDDPLDTETDEQVFPVGVCLLDIRPKDVGTKFWTWQEYREAIATLFRRLPTATAIDGGDLWRADIRPMGLPEAKRMAGPAYQDVKGGSLLLFRVTTEASDA